MGDFPHYFDIILFAMIAVFLALRLRSVLGRRTGNERRRQSMLRQAEPTGDKAKLRPLLSDEVYAPFCAAIDERNAARETLETRIIALKRHDIGEADLAGQMARITVKLVSDQINVVRAHDGSIVDGDPDKAIEKTDFWSFARDTGSSDPNWLLVATDSG